MHPVRELGRGRIPADDKRLLKEEEAAVGAEGVKIESGGKMRLGKGEAAQRPGEATGAEHPEALGVDVDGPAETGLARATEELDDLLIGWIEKAHGLAATANEGQIASGVTPGRVRRERDPATVIDATLQGLRVKSFPDFFPRSGHLIRKSQLALGSGGSAGQSPPRGGENDAF